MTAGATFERDCISAILKRAEVPEGKADRRPAQQLRQVAPAARGAEARLPV